MSRRGESRSAGCGNGMDACTGVKTSRPSNCNTRNHPRFFTMVETRGEGSELRQLAPLRRIRQPGECGSENTHFHGHLRSCLQLREGGHDGSENESSSLFNRARKKAGSSKLKSEQSQKTSDTRTTDTHTRIHGFWKICAQFNQ
jgi:hypothetical protein